MDRSEHGPAVAFLLDDHPQANEVVDVVELLAADHHLLVDAPEVLRPPAHVGLDGEAVELGDEGLHHLLQVRLALGLARGDHLLDLGVTLRVQRGETQVLELPLDLLDTESVRERRVDVEGLLGDRSLAGHGHHRDRAHIVQAVGQLDQQHPPVLGHGDEHLSNGRRLLGLSGIELQTVELRDAIDDRRHLVAELVGQPGRRDAGVLDGVVQQRRGDRGLVEPQVGRDVGHRDGVGHVGLTGSTELALVRVDRHEPGATDQLNVTRLVMLAKTRDEPINRTDQRRIGRRARSETDHGVSLPVT